MMEWLKAIRDDVRNSLVAEVKKFQNREFMEALLAGCALVALADGEIKPEEKRKMIAFIQRSEELKVWSTTEVVALFNKMVDLFEFDYEIGKIDALKFVAKLRTNEDAAKLMVRVCCIIGASDGNFDDDEKRVVREIISTLRLNPKDFQL
jgi:tellurite resistance protein TerB